MPATRDPQVEEMVRHLVAQSPAPPAFPADAQQARGRRHALLVRSAALGGAVAVVVAISLIAAAVLSTAPAARHQIFVGGNVVTPNVAVRPQIRAEVVFDRREDVSSYGAVMAADPSVGMWFLVSAGYNDPQQLDHLDAAGALTSIPLPTQFVYGAGSLDATIAADPDGTVWALGQHDLAEVGPGATSARLFPLGAWPNTEPHFPRVLASDGAGHVAIAFEDTTLVRVFDEATRTFSDIQLPVGTDAWSLRYFHDGSLAIGLFNGANHSLNTVLIASPDGRISRGIHVSDTQLASTYSDTAVLFGTSRDLTVLNRDGTTRAITLPTSLGYPNPRAGAVQVGRAGTLVVTSGAGITILRSASDPVVIARLRFPVVPCGPISGGGPSPTGAEPAVPVHIVCRATPDFVRVAHDGAIWLLYTTQVTGVGHLTVKRIDAY